MVQFCRLHHVKLSTSYLEECAKADDWLQFLIHSQLHNYQPEEVSPDHWPLFSRKWEHLSECSVLSVTQIQAFCLIHGIFTEMSVDLH